MIIIVMGVSGSGKTSVASGLAERLGCGFSDADTFHSAANKAKMAAGTPLNDDDRWPWLDAMRASMAANIAAGETHVYACSALRRIYRDRLRDGDSAHMLFVYLSGSFDLLEERLSRRANHFFDPALLKSQVDTLEVPTDDEAVTVDITPPIGTIIDQVLALVKRRQPG
ncbi:gluconokinase [Robbsia sp. Bb-Pol-6]|uniref:Gluconokinase n=1 Tax=Robbsia betulipollinis TaxID=2981849 RepID=A0ABT3ZQM6_9BURK|nr:gluconokinase [Robbsia betulipollinis]MCY0388869.1 gluconokinase [Robbsia betulipollinis]